MRTIWIIIQREYLTRVRQRSFMISTLAGPAGFAFIIFSSVFLSQYSDGTKMISVIDSGNLLNHAALPDKPDKTLYFRYSELTEDKVKQAFKAEKSEILLVIPAIDKDIKDLNELHVNYYGSKNLGRLDKEYIEDVLQDKLRDIKLHSLKELNEEEISHFDIKAHLSYISTKSGEEKDGAQDAAAAIGLIIGMVIYIMLIFYGVSIMRGVMEEKTSRIVEVIISSVRPFQLLMAKIIGIGLVGMTQFFIWGVCILALNIFLVPVLGLQPGHIQPGMEAIGNTGVDSDEIQVLLTGLAQISWAKLFFFFIFYFISGYMLYGSLFAALGASINEEGDTQSLSMIVTLPIMISFFISINVLNDPSSELAKWASIFPLSSPVVMPVRMAFDPPIGQVILSMVLVVLTFLGATWIASRIYRTGILMHGKKFNLLEISRWIFYKD